MDRMFMKQIITIALIIFYAGLKAQDLGVIRISSPRSDCSLSANETVTLVIKNFGSTIHVGNVNVSYKLNSNTPVTESAPLTILPGDSSTYSFLATVNVSSFGTYSFKAYTFLMNDVNTANDSITNYSITNFPPTVGGTVSSNDSVCSGNNTGTLTLSGQTGSVLNWEFSTDGGSTWFPISNTTTSLTYLNLTTTTMYRAVVQSGTCAPVNSSSVIIVVLPSPNGGTLSGLATVCSISNGGTITLSGQTGTIIGWEYSTDGGVTWNPITNTTATENYNNLTQTTMYRVLVQGGQCTSYSSAVTITVSPATVGGLVSGSTTVCSGTNSGSLQLSGETGNVVRWEYSIDGGATWINVTNTTNTQNYLNLTTTTMYRAVIQSGVCPQANSSPATIWVDPVTVGGTISSNTSVCSGINGGILTLINNMGTVLKWEYSTNNGLNWTNINNTTNTQSYNNLTTTTWYRAIIQSGSCAADTSSVVVVTVNTLPVADAGIDTTISLGYAITLNGSGGVTYSWTPAAGLDDPALQNPSASPTSTTTYTLTVTDANGCTATSTVEVKVLVDYSFIITNLLTPNGDGKNDVWYVENIENYPLCEVSIYSIYEKELFSISPYMNDWNGTFDGKELPDGTYYYVIKCPDVKEVKGYISIIRNR
jgi:gliding motility-associated-like protein